MRYALVLFPITVLILGGCAPVAGTVTATSGSRVDSMTPDIQYVSAEGGSRSFDWARCPIALVAFTSPEGPACCNLDPYMADLADQFADLPVTVAQFSLPQGNRPQGPACPEIANLRRSGMMLLYDGDRLAWNAYGQPAPGELLLIGENGKVLMTASRSDATRLLDEARRLGQAEKDRRASVGGA